jgi:CYTH domain-containing protein
MNDLPLTLTIPLPHHQPRTRGIYATGRFGANIRVRCSSQDAELVTKAAAALGMSESEFIRFVMTHAAAQLLEAVNGDADDPREGSRSI